MKYFLICFSISVALTSNAQKITTDYDKTVDFSNYKTFKFLGWQKDSDKILNDIDKERMRKAFKNECDARELTLSESDADMAVSLFLVVQQKTSTTAYSDYYGLGGGYGRYSRAGWGWGGGYSTTTYTQDDYLQGTLVMDVFDEATGKLIWQGVATGTVTENPQKREKTIPKGIKKLMKKFPIEPVKK